MRPNGLVTRAYLGRGSRIWIGTRVLASGILVFAKTDPIRLPAAAVAQLVLLTVVLGFLDTRRRHERALLGNLAVGPATLILLFAAPAIGGELLVWLAGMSIV